MGIRESSGQGSGGAEASLVSVVWRPPPSGAPGSPPEAQLGCILHLERQRGLASPSPLEALE